MNDVVHTEVRHLTTAELEAGLAAIRQSPRDGGTLELIVRRPAVDGREVLAEGELDLQQGLVGDTWSHWQHGAAKLARMPDRSPAPRIVQSQHHQCARSIALIAPKEESASAGRWRVDQHTLHRSRPGQ